MEGGGREQNYWPGFVDALSNVVLTLVFVLAIFVFALAMASNKVEQKMQEIVHAQEEKKTQTSVENSKDSSMAQENQELKSQIAQMQSEVQNLKLQNEKAMAEVKATGARDTSGVTTAKDNNVEIQVEDQSVKKTLQGALKIKNTADTVVLNYPLTVVDMDDKSATELGHVLEAVKQKTGKKKVLLRSYLGTEPFSEARRLAYYRAIAVRNILISKNLANASDITSTILQPDKPGDGRVEIEYTK